MDGSSTTCQGRQAGRREHIGGSRLLTSCPQGPAPHRHPPVIWHPPPATAPAQPSSPAGQPAHRSTSPGPPHLQHSVLGGGVPARPHVKLLRAPACRLGGQRGRRVRPSAAECLPCCRCLPACSLQHWAGSPAGNTPPAAARAGTRHAPAGWPALRKTSKEARGALPSSIATVTATCASPSLTWKRYCRHLRGAAAGGGRWAGGVMSARGVQFREREQRGAGLEAGAGRAGGYRPACAPAATRPASTPATHRSGSTASPSRLTVRLASRSARLMLITGVLQSSKPIPGGRRGCRGGCGSRGGA